MSENNKPQSSGHWVQDGLIVVASCPEQVSAGLRVTGALGNKIESDQ